MALREILVIPDPRLRETTAKVDKIDGRIKTLVKDMFETMYDAPGIGLAAPQIGVMERVIVVDCAMRASKEEGDDQVEETDDLLEEAKLPDPDPEPIAMINPVIISFSDEFCIYEEGCLSIPEYYEDVERPKSCTVRYTDMDGEQVTRELEGLLSTCVQHEVDHLDGKLFIDYLSRLKRDRVTKKFKKAAKQAAY